MHNVTATNYGTSKVEKKLDTHTVKESGGAETLLRSADCTLWIL